MSKIWKLRYWTFLILKLDNNFENWDIEVSKFPILKLDNNVEDLRKELTDNINENIER